MNIALAFSPSWSSHVEVEVYAIFKNHQAPVKVFLVTDELSKEALDKFYKIQEHFGPGYEVEYLNVDQKFNELITSKANIDSRFTKYTLYRLVLPKLIDVDKLLYIDTDALVNADLSEMYNMDMGDNLIAGVVDTGIYLPQYRYMLFNIGLTMQDAYVNAGVLLFNWKEIRRLNLCDKWIEEINAKLYGCHDQDVINMTCKGRVIVLDPAYNVSLSTSMDVKEEDVKIAHYAGFSDQKGWSNNPKVKFNSIWQRWDKQYRSEIR